MNWLKNILTKLAQQGSINYLLKSNPSLFKEYQEKKKDIIIPEVYSGEAGEILKKWIFYRSKQGESVNLRGLDVILINPNDKAKTWFNKPDFTFFDLRKKNEEYHENLKQTKDRVYTPQYPISILKQYNNGLAWGRLETGYCDSYGKSLGHCGNIDGQDDDTQRIYTFYDTTTNIHYLTFIYHKDGMLGEAKAYGNSKPPIDKIRILNREDLQSVNAQEVYKDLLLLKDKDQYIWNVIRGAGYKPENNFGFQDLNEKNREEVKKERENIDDYFSFREGKDSKNVYFTEDGQIYFNKNITKEQFKQEILHHNSKNFLEFPETYNEIVKFNLQHDKDVIEKICHYPHYSLLLASALNFDLNEIHQDLIDSISKSADKSYDFLAYVDFNLDRVPKQIINGIAQNSRTCYYFALNFHFDLSKIPKEIIEGIANDPLSSIDFIGSVGYNLSNVPKEIINRITKHPVYSLTVAEKLKFDLNKIPKEIIESISRESNMSFTLAYNLKLDFNKIPEEIINSISRNSERSFNCLKELRFNFSKIPKKIMYSILNDSHECMNLIKKVKLDKIPQEYLNKIYETIATTSMQYSYELSSILRFDLNKIPKEIIESISSHPKYSYGFAKNLNLDLTKIPKIIIDGICKDPKYAFDFAISFDFDSDFNKIPKEIIESISKSPNLSYGFSQILKFDLNRIPKNIISGICKDQFICLNFIKKSNIDLNKMPQEIISEISKSHFYSYDAAFFFNFDLNKIPKEIIESIAKDSGASYDFAVETKFNLSKIPKSIIESILKDEDLKTRLINNLKENKIEIPQWIKEYELV